MYLIGSRFRKGAGDWDLVLEEENFASSKGIDICPKELELLEVCQKFDSGEVVETPLGIAKVVSPIGLMIIRRSHLRRPLNFSKNILEYHRMKKEFGPIPEEDFPLLEKITKANKKLYGDKTPSLNKSKADFFDDYVTKYYDHDDIHRATCYYDEPIFTKLKPDSDKVWCSKSKFFELSLEDRIRCVREEGFVIALERFIIPKIKNSEKAPPPRFCFEKALNKICTTLTSGWFRDFAIENYIEIISHNYPFMERFTQWDRTLKNS